MESLNGKLRDELLNGEMCYTVAEARVLIERWREHSNLVRPHSALGYRPPAPEVSLLDRPPLRSGPASSDFRIGRLLRNLCIQQQKRVNLLWLAVAHSLSGQALGTWPTCDTRIHSFEQPLPSRSAQGLCCEGHFHIRAAGWDHW